MITITSSQDPLLRKLEKSLKQVPTTTNWGTNFTFMFI
jgi:hypothetical protein